MERIKLQLQMAFTFVTLELLVSVLLIMPSVNVRAEFWAEKFPVGSSFPEITAIDQSGKTWNRQKLSGENGSLILFNRSTVW